MGALQMVQSRDQQAFGKITRGAENHQGAWTGVSRLVHDQEPGLGSLWPPNSLRMAESSLLANCALSRERKRAWSAADSTSAGTPVSRAAINVQRPSPESSTKPEKRASSESFESAIAVRSSSQDPMTLPWRHSS